MAIQRIHGPGPEFAELPPVARLLLRAVLAVAIVAVAIYALRPVPSAKHPIDPAPSRLDAIHRARVWTPTNVAAKDMRAGPQGPGAFAPDQLVRCEYVEASFEGKS